MSPAPLNAAWDDRPAEYDQHRDGHLNQRRTAFLLERLGDLPEGAHVVELGSGTGWLGLRLAAALPQITYTGVDPLSGYVEYAAGRADQAGLGDRVRYRTGTAEGLEELLAGEPPAAVLLANDVLHHVADLGATARAATAVSAPDARWLVVEPNAVNPYVWVTHKLKDGEAIFRWRTFRAAAAAAGWRTEEQSSLFLIPPQITAPPAWAQRLERRLEHVRPLAGGIALELRRV